MTLCCGLGDVLLDPFDGCLNLGMHLGEDPELQVFKASILEADPADLLLEHLQLLEASVDIHERNSFKAVVDAIDLITEAFGVQVDCLGNTDLVVVHCLLGLSEACLQGLKPGDIDSRRNGREQGRDNAVRQELQVASQVLGVLQLLLVGQKDGITVQAKLEGVDSLYRPGGKSGGLEGALLVVVGFTEAVPMFIGVGFADGGSLLGVTGGCSARTAGVSFLRACFVSMFERCRMVSTVLTDT